MLGSGAHTGNWFNNRPSSIWSSGVTSVGLPPGGVPFWGRFFESGHYIHIVTLLHVPVAPAACDLTRPGAAPVPAGRELPPPAPGLRARVQARSDPAAVVPGRATPPGSDSSRGGGHSPAAGAQHPPAAARWGL